MPVERLEIGMRVLFVVSRDEPPLKGTIVRRYSPTNASYLFHSDTPHSAFHDGDGTLPWGYGYWVGKGNVDYLNDKRPKSGFSRWVETQGL